LLQADQLIDGERYTEAEKVLRQVLEVNPFETRATAYLAVLAQLKNDLDGEKSLRTLALSRWAQDPEVDHLIGRKLSEKYRFADGASHQRAALELDSGYLPSKIQLCQDLLRLGEETQGWKLADEIFAQDGYNVVAYNLGTLRDRIAGFRTLTDDGLILRMDSREADLYGQRALSILRLARKTLGAKYDVVLDQPVIVEIFPQRKDFAVRTFGLPGAEGFLGVCFGRVVTANSPASQGEHPSNWESVLWHEFCHVVTLKKTRNKMPRWLSEGISVYEEENRDPAWGTPLNPRFRAMLLDPKLTPLSKLSAAFLAPESGVHLQFAYQESALAVHFLVERLGLETLKSVLDDLGAGLTINEALPHRSKMSLEQMDREFAEFARAKARKVAPDATWEEPEFPEDADSSAISAWLEQHPNSFHGSRRLCARLVVEEKWDRAVVSLERLKQLYPEYVGPENAYVMLADVYKRTANRTAERAALEQLAARDGSSSPAYLRLMELDLAAADWPKLAIDAHRFLAVNPLVPAPYRMLGRAADQLGDRTEAINAYRALALLDDADPADVHYRLAKLLRDAGDRSQARREVLMSLEEAPRFLAAHRLLLELVEPVLPTTGAPLPSPRPRR
jgi:tetratricopeptide (TPR) repeat protein